MRKLFIAAILIMASSALFAEVVETVQPTAILVKSSSTDDAALDSNTTNWADTSSWVELSKMANQLVVQFYVYDTNGPNNVTFNYDFYVVNYGGSAQKVAAGSATCGGAKLSHSPVTLEALNNGDPNSYYCWADTLGAITTDWSPTPTLENNDGLNDVASLRFDRKSAKRAYCRIYNRSWSTMTVYCVAYYY